MDEFLPPDKLLLAIGLFQFGLIFLIFMITNLSKRKISNDQSPHDSKTSIISTEAVSQTNISNLSTSTPNSIITESPQFTNNEIVQESIIPSPSSDRRLPNLSNSPQNSPDHPTHPESHPPIETVYSVNIAPELFTELMEISNNPAGIVDEAIRWWLRRRNLESLDTSIDLDRRYRVGMRSHSKRSQQDLWND
jgi:hypothetical protein